jgi:hypothetical protein
LERIEHHDLVADGKLKEYVLPVVSPTFLATLVTKDPLSLKVVDAAKHPTLST